MSGRGRGGGPYGEPLAFFFAGQQEACKIGRRGSRSFLGVAKGTLGLVSIGSSLLFVTRIHHCNPENEDFGGQAV